MQKFQNINTTKYEETKCKRNKIQIEQNAKIPKYKSSKIKTLIVPMENQCVKGGGLLYGGCILVFLLFVFCSICIWLYLYFVTFVFLQLVFCSVVFCRVCILEFLHFVLFAFDSKLVHTF